MGLSSHLTGQRRLRRRGEVALNCRFQGKRVTLSNTILRDYLLSFQSLNCLILYLSKKSVTFQLSAQLKFPISRLYNNAMSNRRGQLTHSKHKQAIKQFVYKKLICPNLFASGVNMPLNNGSHSAFCKTCFHRSIRCTIDTFSEYYFLLRVALGMHQFPHHQS